MTDREPMVAMIHATATAIGPAADAFEERFPEARLWNILDDRLLVDADAAGGVVPRLRRRMMSLITYAIEGGSGAVVLTCSQYGPGAELAAPLYEVPVVGSDDAMLAWVVDTRPTAVAVLGSLEGSVADSTQRLERLVGESGGRTRVKGVMCPGAAAAAGEGDRAALLTSIFDEAERHRGTVDAFLLAQYSLTPVRRELERLLGAPVLSPPHLAADALRTRLEFAPLEVVRAPRVAATG